MKRIAVVSAGGTIAGVSTDRGYTSGVLSVDELLRGIPQLQTIAAIEPIHFCSIGSQDMDFSTLQGLMQTVQSLLDRDEMDGAVVTHGTDTMEESAYFANLVLNSEKPVVFTGAMKPSSAVDADGPGNLIDAVRTASSDCMKGKGAVVVMNGLIHSAHACRKAHTLAIDSFDSGGYSSVGFVDAEGNVHLTGEPHWRHTVHSEFHASIASELPRVDIFYGCTQMPVDLLKASLTLGAQGIVLAGVGNGNVSGAVLEAVQDASKEGIAVVRSSRVTAGTVVRNGEIDDEASGTVVSDSLSAPKARVLLTAALGAGVSRSELQRIFFEY